MYGINYGEIIDEKAEIRPEYGIQSKDIKAGERNPGFAAIMSTFIPGLGQIYNGEMRNGIGFILIGVIFGSIALTLLWKHHMIGPTLVASGSYLLFWIYNIYDAFKTAKMIQRIQINSW